MSDCSSQDKKPKGKKSGYAIKQFISCQTLENAGFEHMDGMHFDLLFKNKDFYVLNDWDRRVVRFENGMPANKYSSIAGQAPSEFMTPRSMFSVDSSTIGVVDIQKARALLFDDKLNYLKEYPLPMLTNSITRVKDTWVSFQVSQTRDMVFDILDEQFKPVEKFLKANTKVPFEHYYNVFLNKGKFLYGGLAAHSYSLFPYKACHIDIFNIAAREKTVTLEWEQPFTPSDRSIQKGINLYFLERIFKTGRFYTVQCVFGKTLAQPYDVEYDMLIFSESGALEFRDKFPYLFIAYQSDKPESRVFFMDKDENMAYIDIEELMKQK